MDIIPTHVHQLRFRIDSNAPNMFIEKWIKIKNKCENENDPTAIRKIAEQIKYHCVIQSNKDLPHLERVEGLLGGNDNQTDKQIRFRMETIWYVGRISTDSDIVICISDTETQKWTYDELDDIVRAFIITMNHKLHAECISGCIELIPKKSFRDDYLHDV
jgi:hypothetical protein